MSIRHRLFAALYDRMNAAAERRNPPTRNGSGSSCSDQEKRAQRRRYRLVRISISPFVPLVAFPKTLCVSVGLVLLRTYCHRIRKIGSSAFRFMSSCFRPQVWSGKGDGHARESKSLRHGTRSSRTTGKHPLKADWGTLRRGARGCFTDRSR